MATNPLSTPPICSGDLDGLGRVYSATGALVLFSGEELLATQDGCDLHASESWRSFFAKTLFSAIPGKVTGKLYLTDRRLVLIRDVDVWKEVKPLLTPLGLPTAAQKEARLKDLKSRGARQYCEIQQQLVTLSRSRENRSMLFLYLTTTSQRRYRVVIYVEAADTSLFPAIKARFAR